ncbi:MAG: TVP38/TMEM64 family protein [Planctomycetota bacterium]
MNARPTAPMIAADPSRNPPSSHWPATLAAATVVAATLAALAFREPLASGVESLLEQLRGLGPWGPVAFVLIYVAATVLMAPGAPLTLGAGLVWGVLGGTALVSIASVAGATAAFLVGRGAGRNWVDGLAARYPRFAAVDEAVGRSGWRIVLLTRLSPLFPFNALNYLYGATRVGLRDYVVASWIGMLPGTLLYVYLGAAAGRVVGAASTDSVSVAKQAVFYGGLLATLGVTVLATRLARQALANAQPPDEPEAADPSQPQRETP